MSDGSKTDERVESPDPRPRDMDARFLSGCLGIAFLSLLFYGMLVWPFFVFPTHQSEGLRMIGLAGALPQLVLGAALVRRFGLEAATAFAGGSLAGAIFAFLRIDSLMLGKLDFARGLPAPDYPDSWAWLIPVAWCLVVVSTILLLLPRRELNDEGPARTDR